MTTDPTPVPVPPVTLAQIVAALDVTYTDKGVAMWLTMKNSDLMSKPDGNWRCTPAEYVAAGHIAEEREAGT